MHSFQPGRDHSDSFKALVISAKSTAHLLIIPIVSVFAVTSSADPNHTDQYAVPIPPLLPPTFKGKSLSFAYQIRLSLSVALPLDEVKTPSPRLGEGRSWGLWNRRVKEEAPQQRIVEKELTVPIRVLPSVTGTSSEPRHTFPFRCSCGFQSLRRRKRMIY
jgi:hypothetical protein